MFRYLALDAPIYVAGHLGVAGSAIVRELKRQGYTKLIVRSHAELDLSDQAAVFAFFDETRPAHVILAAGRQEGIQADRIGRAEVIYQNLMIQTNVIDAAYRYGVERLLFVCGHVYPRDCPQPIKEGYLLGGPLEPLRQTGSVARLAGVEMCWSYNRQYGTRYLAVIPANVYGLGADFHPARSHVIPALIHKAYQAKLKGDEHMEIWGSGNQRREFIYSDDLAAACVFLLNLETRRYDAFLQEKSPPLINVGVGYDMSIRVLAETICRVVGYQGELVFNQRKPEGGARQLLDVSRLNSMGWLAQTGLTDGLGWVYRDYCIKMADAEAQPASHEA